MRLIVPAVAELLPRFHRRQTEIEDERKIDKILLETGDPNDADAPPMARGADGHDWQRRRGLPLIGRGVSGARTDTNPVAALLANERAGRL